MAASACYTIWVCGVRLDGAVIEVVSGIECESVFTFGASVGSRIIHPALTAGTMHENEIDERVKTSDGHQAASHSSRNTKIRKCCKNNRRVTGKGKCGRRRRLRRSGSLRDRHQPPQLDLSPSSSSYPVTMRSANYTRQSYVIRISKPNYLDGLM
jgi:hypothetical protein